MTDKIEQVKCQCGHPKYTHNVFTGECEVRTCKCTLYSQEPQQVVCPNPLNICKEDDCSHLLPHSHTKDCDIPCCDNELNGSGCISVSQSETPDELKPKIVCLCGSTRFSEAFQKAQFDLTMAGEIVLTIGCNMKTDTELQRARSILKYMRAIKKLKSMGYRVGVPF